ncbi:putative bifunctional diguanylate cyclase/phosphodiesterase [Ningiella sp. W23]|uniref:putative bifunctional diguanylate cyclase/phosphodiesterase n=1 Tax=Ningiella sp. W23 TaxID=3023715 RepID=UPI003756623E
MHSSLIQALGIVDCVILQRMQDKQFQIIQNNMQWFPRLFDTKEDQHLIDLNGQSLFLSDFLVDAVNFWNMHSIGQVESGIWTEQRGDDQFYLEAVAASTEDAQYLVIKNVHQDFQKKQETLQVARELLISNDEIVERHDYLNERLRSMLIDGVEEISGLPLYDAIQMADIGVIILDAQLMVQETNPAVRQIFEMPPTADASSIFKTLSDLLSRQFPEKEQLFKSYHPFSGELYWHQPPLLHKWLKTDIQPIKGNSGEVNNWVVTISDVTRIKYLTQTNEELVLHDPLTGLPNRQYFWQELNRQTGAHNELQLLVVDIVNFKKINESFGYTQGDELLKQFSSRIKSSLPSGVFMARVGANEFMVIYPQSEQVDSQAETSLVEAPNKSRRDLGNRVLELVAAPFYLNNATRCELKVKAGISCFPTDASSPEELLNCADLALTSAKRSDELDSLSYSSELKVASQRRIMLENALKMGLDQGQLELYLQPIFDLKDSRIIKAEALLRWRFGEQQVSPDEFIPIAESSGLINLLGRYVIKHACILVSKLNAQGITIPVSINFSPKQIHDSNLIDYIRECMTNSSIASDALELEVTEGVFVHDYEKVSGFLQAIKETGLSVSVDDFGTGYSSLSYLKHLPIDALKIDRSFISDVALNEDDQAIVSAILAMASKLKLQVIAEGVETSPQMNYLLDNSCSQAQGFIFSEALPVDAFISLYQSKADSH